METIISWIITVPKGTMLLIAYNISADDSKLQQYFLVSSHKLYFLKFRKIWKNSLKK